jgi:amidophosphoribosyltransferase
MSRELGADTLRYLPVASVARAIGLPAQSLCQACITGDYPTPWGRELYQIACEQAGAGSLATRTYERPRQLTATK